MDKFRGDFDTASTPVFIIAPFWSNFGRNFALFQITVPQPPNNSPQTPSYKKLNKPPSKPLFILYTLTSILKNHASST